jgi:hypothetical protein
MTSADAYSALFGSAYADVNGQTVTPVCVPAAVTR